MKRKITLVILAVSYALCCRWLSFQLPGITDVEIRPHIVLLFAAGYLLGPWQGFLVGFAGNVCADILLGSGCRYLISWSIGNGLIGALTGLLPQRRYQVERIGQLAGLLGALIFVNVAALTYAAGVENILNKELTTATNLRFFYFPALLSNVLATMLLFPLILLFFRRLKRNYSIKLALADYYLGAGMLIIAWMAFTVYRFNTLDLPDPILDIQQGNDFVIAFNRWAFLMVLLLLSSFLVSSWMSKTILAPLKQLEEIIYSTLRGDDSSPARLTVLSGRKDEIGILSYALRLLSESLWDAQRLFRDELRMNMSYLDEGDSGADILCTALVSLFGRDALTTPSSSRSDEMAGELSAINAISLTITAAGLRELATTYSEAKIESSFNGLDIPASVLTLPHEQRQLLALAVDLKLIFKGRLRDLDVTAPLSRDFAFHLLERIYVFQRKGRNYVGYVTAPDIIGSIRDAWEHAESIRNEYLEKGLNRAVAQGLISGYHIKKWRERSMFDTPLSIAYSHSDMKHIKQMTGLLASEKLQAKITLESKRSSFRYLEEWEKDDGLCLERLPDGGLIAHKDECDLVFEFVDEKNRIRFAEMVDTFAHRELDDPRTMLYNSWFRPLYASSAPLEGHQRIADITVKAASDIAHVYVMESSAENIMVWMQQEWPELKMAVSPIWVNNAFFTYLENYSA